MASISKHKNGWRSQVYVNGIRRSKLFETKTEAKILATYTEAELRQQRDDARDGVISFSALLDEYGRRVSVHKKGHDWERKQFVVLKRTKLASMMVHEITKSDISRWKDDRLSEVTGSTVNRQMNLLSHLFTKAVEWGYADKNPVKQVSRPKENEARSRLASEDELAAIQKSSGWDGETPPTTVGQRVYVAFLFSCETAMRQGEVASIRPDNVVGRIVHLTDTKNGSERYVPLSPRAQELLKLVENDFGLSASQIESNWRLLTKDAKVHDLHYHDSRHIGTTRLAQKVEVLDLSKITGHKDLKQLMRYYHQTPDQLADKLA